MDFQHYNYSGQPQKGTWSPTLSNSIPASRRPETDLLVCCARTRLDPETTQRIHSLSQKGIDWEYLLGLASRHRVMPLLCRSLEKACAQVIPEKILERLRAYITYNTSCITNFNHIVNPVYSFTNYYQSRNPVRNDFLKAKSYEVGKSLIEADMLDTAARLMEQAKTTM